MSPKARFLHQFRHDVISWRWRLVIYWALLLLSIPSLWAYQNAVSDFGARNWSLFLLNAFPGSATLLAALSLAALLENAAPNDPEAFGSTRPMRTDVVLGSRLLIFLAGYLAPWMLQQALLCQLAIGAVPWQDLWVRLLTGLLPYAACVAFAVTLGSTTRQKAVLTLAALIFLFFIRVQDRGDTDGVFGIMPMTAQYYLALPKQMFYSFDWPSMIPQPARVMNYQLLLLLVGVVMTVLVWRRWGRTFTAAVFCAAAIACSMVTKHILRSEPPYLTSGEESALGLEKTTINIAKPGIARTQPPGMRAVWSLNFQPTFEQLPPSRSSMLGVADAVLTTPDHQKIHAQPSDLYRRWPAEQEINANMRLAPAFRRALLGTETENLGLSKKESADELYVSHVMQPDSQVFVDTSSAQAQPTTFSVQGGLALPITEYRVIARAPFRTGLVCHATEGLDVHLTQITPKFRTARTSTGTVQQWSGVETRFWLSSLIFDHSGDDQWNGSGLVLILYHPARHEVLADMVRWYDGQHLAGTPIRLASQYEELDLDPSRVGTVDEKWLDDAEMILVQGRYVGTLKRPLLLENLKPEMEKKKP